MVTGSGRVNRGPAAAIDNRRALLTAARRVFAERGYRVPLSTIAREAGVGQAVLYRHFPTRHDLAFAVFEDNLVDLEAIVADPDPGAFGRLWSRLIELTIQVSAFVEMMVDARGDLPDYRGGERLRELVETALPRAQQAGLTDPTLTVDDVLLAWRMTFGVVVTATERSEVRAAVDRAVSLLRLP